MGEIADRVWKHLDAQPIRNGETFKRIGIYKKGYKHITIVVNYDRRCVDGFLIMQWATESMDKAPKNLTRT